MISANRGGLTLKTGKIGRVNCLRQQVLLPGETVDIRLNGKVRLESLRERDSLRINAHLAVFATPLRWLWPEFPDYLKEGPDTAITMPTATDDDWAKYGIGSFMTTQHDYAEFFRSAYHRVYNEWYKWPEADDISGPINSDGEPAVPLQKPWSRARFSTDPDDTADYTVSSGTNFDVRELAEVQARFKSAMKRDVLSYNRYMELLDEMYGADGSREVDQVPVMIDQQEIGVNPREIPATDGASLGQWQSLFDFGVDHRIRGVAMPEHCVLTYMLTVRFSAVTESIHPLARPQLNWFERVGDANWMESAPPVALEKRHYFGGNASDVLGYLPAGWQWRCDHDVIGKRIDARDSFPMMLVPDGQSQAKNATRVVDAFRSQSLGDYVADIFISENSRLPIGTAMQSYMANLEGSSNKSEFPAQGKQL